MIIEIEGAGFINKGAELMLRSVVHEVGGWSPDLHFVVSPSVGRYEERARVGLWQKLDMSRFGRLQGVIRRCVAPQYRRRFGLVIPEEVDAVLDASGFRYSDQWGAGTSRSLAQRTEAARRAGRPYVLLPQAFGPFADAGTREAFGEAMTNVDLVFARDIDSLEHLRGVMGDDPRLLLAPDFTAALPGLRPEMLPIGGDLPVAAVVPNYRMIDKTDADTSARYSDFLRASITELSGLGFQPVLVVHSGGSEDGNLAQRLSAEMPVNVPVFEEKDARRLKGFIGTCEVLVGSRFHALASGFAQEVPCIGTGWSHKYQRLFEGYGCPEYLVDLRGPVEEALECVRRIAEPAERERLRGLIGRTNVRIHAEIRNMWDRVRDVIFPGPSGKERG